MSYRPSQLSPHNGPSAPRPNPRYKPGRPLMVRNQHVFTDTLGIEERRLLESQVSTHITEAVHTTNKQKQHSRREHVCFIL